MDDHDLIRQGLRRAFERAGDFQVVGEASSVAGGCERFTALHPAVVICDVRLADGSGLDLVRRIRSLAPTTGVVVLTMHAGDDELFAAMEAGASCFVTKDAPAKDVVTAARHAAVSPRSFSANQLTEALKRRLTVSRPQLSPREREVITLLAAGLSIAAISKQLFISESTTKSHISKLYEKLGAGNRAQALMTAMRLGIISSEPG